MATISAWAVGSLSRRTRFWPAANDHIAVDRHGPDGHFAGFGSRTGFGKRRFHRFLIRNHHCDGIAPPPNTVRLSQTRGAGCCWVMQCSAPSPQIRSTE